MTVRTPIALLNASGAERPGGAELRVLFKQLAASSRGVPGAGTDLVVTQNGTPNMSVNVAAGTDLIPATEGAAEGYYFFYNDATVNVAVAAADPTNPRRDLVIADIRDSQYSGANDDARLTILQGTAAASPVDPDPVAAGYKNYDVIARVAVAAAASSIVTANITDLRVKRAARVPVTSSVRSSGDLTINGTGFANVDTGMDLSIAAVAGDKLQVGIAGVWEDQATNGGIAVRGVTRAADDVGPVGTGGLAGTIGFSGMFQSFATTFIYTVVSGDINAGLVALRLRARTSSATNKVLRAGSVEPLSWYVKNLGQ